MGGDARGGFKLTPVWVVTIVFCVLLVYVVVKKVDDIREVKIAEAGGIVFGGSTSPVSLPLDVQRERSRQIEQKVEEEIHNAPAPLPVPVRETPAADLSGMWTTFDGTARWMVSRENNLYAFREESLAIPGVISAAGYGTFDGRTWSLQFETIIGAGGTASIHLQDDGTLRGEAAANGNHFPVSLHR